MHEVHLRIPAKKNILSLGGAPLHIFDLSPLKRLTNFMRDLKKSGPLPQHSPPAPNQLVFHCHVEILVRLCARRSSRRNRHGSPYLPNTPPTETKTSV